VVGWASMADSSRSSVLSVGEVGVDVCGERTAVFADCDLQRRKKDTKCSGYNPTTQLLVCYVRFPLQIF